MISTENVGLEKMGYGPSGGFPHQPYGFSGSGSGYGYESHGSSGKKSIALSALTLLAFLFFLHILQTCIQEHISSNTGSTSIVVLSREANRMNPTKRQKGDIETMEDDIEWERMKGRTLKEQKGEIREKVKVKFDTKEEI